MRAVNEAIARLISIAVGDRSEPVSPYKMNSLMQFMIDNYGKGAASHFKSGFDFDEEEKAWFWHTEPGEVFLAATDIPG